MSSERMRRLGRLVVGMMKHVGNDVVLSATDLEDDGLAVWIEPVEGGGVSLKLMAREEWEKKRRLAREPA